MGTLLKRSIIGSLAALVVAASTIGAVSPAAADYYHGGWHHGGGWHRGGFWGPAVGLGIAGLAAGAIVASQAPYGYYGYRGYDGYDGCAAWRPVYDAYGNYVGRRVVNVC